MTSEIKKKYYYVSDKEKLQLHALIIYNLLRNSLTEQVCSVGWLGVASILNVPRSCNTNLGGVRCITVFKMCYVQTVSSHLST